MLWRGIPFDSALHALVWGALAAVRPPYPEDLARRWDIAAVMRRCAGIR